MLWQCVGHHLKANKGDAVSPNNAYITYREKDMLYIGLGSMYKSNLSFRSKVGASLAVMSAVEVLKHHSKHIFEDEDIKKRKIAFRNTIKAITALWGRKVLDHLRKNPFNSSELDVLNADEQVKLSKSAYHAYGANLIFAVIYKNHLLGFSLGEFNIFFSSSSGKMNEIILDVEKNSIVNENVLISIDEAYKKAEIIDTKIDKYDYGIIVTSSCTNASKGVGEQVKSLAKNLYSIYNEKGESSNINDFEMILEKNSSKSRDEDITACLIYK